MKAQIKIPALGESIRQVTIGAILKATGTNVREDEEILELETDKLNQVLYAPQTGVITFTVQAGDTATVGDVIGYIDDEGVPAGNEKEVAKPKPKLEVKEPEVKVSEAKQPEVKQPEVKQSEKQQKPAKQPESTTHTSPAGIVKNEWIKELKESKASSEVPFVSSEKKGVSNVQGQDVRKPLSNLRKAMAKRLLESSHSTAMLTTFNEADMSEVIKLRELYKEAFIARYKTKLGFMSFFVKACVSALGVFPQVNSYLEGETQVFRGSIDIGVAVSSERGLVVPVLKNANTLSFAEIEQQIDDFALRAKTGTLTFDDLKGGGFTITNGGLFGSMLSTPILNPPQCAILGMHKITKRAVVIDDQIVIRPMMYLALSYDHRVLDGKEAVSFLVHIKNMIEDPHRLELQI